MHSAMTALFVGVLACALLLAAAAPAPEDAAAATPATTAAPPTQPGPLAQAFETLLKEGPERAKKFGEGLRSNAEKIRGRLQEDLAKIVAPPASPTKDTPKE
ncbi:uncharacterized protein LOC113212397 [Frankliniella occidentalis]|uniref:Uncharacterized protein LOC113212397 n=1 Tax=Frankliniella occidentalis TaxID=133901 RepID=A0A9C6U7H1_FRAOC|nr:uncharacterized protein LOC113212397 [Frankliniella occidentalis]